MNKEHVCTVTVKAEDPCSDAYIPILCRITTYSSCPYCTIWICFAELHVSCNSVLGRSHTWKVNRAWQAVRQACSRDGVSRDEAGIIPIREQNKTYPTLAIHGQKIVLWKSVALKWIHRVTSHSQGKWTWICMRGRMFFNGCDAGNERQAENTVYLPASWEHNPHYTPQSLRTVSPAQTSTCTIRKPQWIILTDCSLEYLF